jgi:cytochrome c oxidase subunit I
LIHLAPEAILSAQNPAFPAAASPGAEVHGPPHGWRRWVYACNHKDIGTMYLFFSLTMFMVGGILALLIRTELFQPGLQFFNPEL